MKYLICVLLWTVGAYSSTVSCNDRKDPLNEKFFIAIDQRNVTYFEDVIKAGGNVNYCRLYSVLSYAILKQQANIVKFIGRVRASDLNIVDSLGNTPIIYAIRAEENEILVSLLVSGAHPNVKSRLNRTPLFLTVLDKQLDKARVLLKFGADPNIRSHNGESPLVMAARYNNLEAIRLLLNYNSDPHIKDNLGKNALYWAKHHKNILAINLIESKM